jgi:hypothetical protein
MSIDDQELRALAFLALRVRRATPGAGPWDENGLMANLRKIANRNLHMTIEHVLRHAADPKAKTPGVIQGSHTPAAPVADKRAHPPKRHEACPRCGGFKGNCACQHESRAWDDDERTEPMTKQAALAAARAALSPSPAQPNAETEEKSDAHLSAE